MSDFKTRLIQERDDLQEKTEKLVAFLHTDEAHVIPEIQRELLRQQHSHMYGYLSVLNQRLENL